MKNSRVTDNPAKKNEHLYSVFLIDKRNDKSWNRQADYYILQGNYRREGFILQTKRLPDAMHTGIIIVDENIRKVLEGIDWNEYAVKNIVSYQLSPAEIHIAVNEKLR